MNIRRSVCLCLLYTIITLTHAQNWDPFTPDETFHYSIPGNNYIETSIKVDSVAYPGGDSVWYLNKIFTPCDTCDQNWCNVHDSCIFIDNQPQFAGYSIRFLPGGNYKVEGKDTFLICPDSGLGASWIFEPQNSILATIDSVYADSVLGEADSLKLILLSNGDTILLSQTHGIVYWGYDTTKTLCGIQERNLGLHLIDFWDVFDFQVGDMFEYSYNYWWASAPAFGGDWYQQKFTVLSRTQNSDTLIFDVQKVYSGTYDNGNDPHPTSGTAFESWVFVNSDQHIANSLPHKRIIADSCGDPDEYFHWVGAGRSSFTLSHPGFGGRNSLSMGIPIFGDFFGSPFLYTSNGLGQYGNAGEGWVEVGDGIGFTAYGLSGFETWLIVYMTAAYTDGDTIGILTPDSVLLGNQKQNVSSSHIILFPNPATNGEQVTISCNEFSIDAIEIYAADGKLVKEINGGTKTIEVDVSDLSSGLYFVRMQVNGGWGMNKLMLSW